MIGMPRSRSGYDFAKVLLEVSKDPTLNVEREDANFLYPRRPKDFPLIAVLYVPKCRYELSRSDY